MDNNLNVDNVMSPPGIDYTANETRRANIAIYGVILTIMVMVGRIQEFLPGMAVIKLGKIAFGLTFILFLITPKRKDISIFSIPQMKYIFALFLIGLASTPFGSWPAESLNFMLFTFSYALLFLFFIVKITATYADLNKIVGSMFFMLILLGVGALLSGKERVATGSSYDPNDLAFIMLIFLPLFYFKIRNTRGLFRLLLVAGMIVLVVVIMATGSRGGFIGLIAVFIGIFIKERISLTGIILSGMILFLSFMFFAPSGYSERISSIFKPDYNRTAAGGRIEIWKRGLELTFHNPILGVGPSTFGLSQGNYTSKKTGTVGVWMTAHNSFIQIATEFGIPGFVLFVMILYSSIRSLRNSLRILPADSNLRWLINALEIGFYGYIVSGFFLSQAYSYALFLLIGLTIAVTNQAAQMKEHPLNALS